MTVDKWRRSTPSGRGYWLVGADGGVLSFGDADFHGSTGGDATADDTIGVVTSGVVTSGDGGGYGLISRTGMPTDLGDSQL